MTQEITQQLVAAVHAAITYVQLKEKVTYDDIWHMTACLVAQTLILTPKDAHAAAFADLESRAKAIVAEFDLDHSRRIAT